MSKKQLESQKRKTRTSVDEIKLMHRFYDLDQEKKRKKKRLDNQRAFYKPLD